MNNILFQPQLQLLDPAFITGFTNADASFIISINRVNTLKTKYRVTPKLVYTQHDNDRIVLEHVNYFFNNGGHLIKDKRYNCLNLVYNSLIKINNNIILHFDKYLLKGQKFKDYLIFKEIIILMNKKEHLTIEGLILIIYLSLNMYSQNKSKMKRHILSNLERQYPEINIKTRLSNILENINSNYESNISSNIELDPWYVSGLIQGDGSITVIFNNKIENRSNIINNIYYKEQNKENKYNFKYPKEKQQFSIGLEKNSINILEQLKLFFNNKGNIYKINDNFYRYMINSKKDIIETIIPFLDKYPMLGNKNYRYKKTKKYILNFDNIRENKEFKLEVYNLFFEGKKRKKKKEKGIV